MEPSLRALSLPLECLCGMHHLWGAAHGCDPDGRSKVRLVYLDAIIAARHATLASHAPIMKPR